VQALIGITGRKAHAGGLLSQMWNPRAQPGNCIWYWQACSVLVLI